MVISLIRWKYGTGRTLQWKANRKSYVVIRMIPSYQRPWVTVKVICCVKHLHSIPRKTACF